MVLIILLSILMICAFVATYLFGEFAIIEEDWKLWIITFLSLFFAFLILSGLITCLIK
jgi:hypothetical protein